MSEASVIQKLPDNLVIVSREWYEKMAALESDENTLDGEIKDMRWATTLTNLSYPTLVNRLVNPRLRNLLDVENGGCVRYSTGNGSPWKFYAKDFKKFVDNNKNWFMK